MVFNKHSRARTVAGAVAAGLLTLGTAGVGIANAHDLVVSSTPENGSTISEPVNKISMTFSGEPREGFNTVAVSRDGKVLFTAEPQADGRVLSVDVPDDFDWESGDYKVGYQITSSDGHATRGAVGFEYVGGNESDGSGAASESSDTSDKAADQEAESADSGVPSWLFAVAGIVVVAGALVLAIAKWRSLNRNEE